MENNQKAMTCEQFVLQHLYELQEKYNTVLKLWDEQRKLAEKYENILDIIGEHIDLQEHPYSGKDFISVAIGSDSKGFHEVWKFFNEEDETK